MVASFAYRNSLERRPRKPLALSRTLLRRSLLAGALVALGIHSRPGCGRLIDRPLLLPICPPTSPVSLRNYFGRWATALPTRLSKRKIFFNPCLVCPIQDCSFRELTFPFGALRLEQMAPTRPAAQDFPGASHFKALGYRLFRLTSSDRFWHKEPVKYASPGDSQAQSNRFWWGEALE